MLLNRLIMRRPTKTLHFFDSTISTNVKKNSSTAMGISIDIVISGKSYSSELSCCFFFPKLKFG